jgi:hypothetical protein
VYSKPHYVTTSDLEQEAKTGIIKLDDHDPDIVDHMINFMYSGDYTISYPDLNEIEESEACLDEDAESETTGLDVGELDASQELLVHTAVYLIAEEKDILALKQLAKKKYEAALPNGWNSMAFCDSLRIIYDETPENDRLLWDVAISFAGKKAKELMDRGEFVKLWKEKGEIGLAVFRAHLLSNGCQNNTPTTAPLNSLAAFGNTTTRAGTCPTGGTAHVAFVVISRNRRTSWFCSVCRKAFN